MNFTQSKKFNSNYAARLINIKDFYPHPKPSVTKMKVAKVEGNRVLVGIDSQPGMYLYFPPGSVINPGFLAANNLFRHSELNRDTTKSGYFDNVGKVKMLKLQDFYSEGLLIEAETISNWTTDSIDNLSECVFDTINDEWLCKKYVIHHTSGSGRGKKGSNKPSKKVRESKLLEEQFRFHYNTAALKDCPFVIKPNTLIHCSYKVHGTSGVSAYVLCKKPNTLWNKILKFLKISDGLAYDYLWSSRKVVKNQYYNEDVSTGFYGCDVWGEAHKILQPKLEKGMTLYYEIIGYLPTGGAIQALGGKAYDYGCTIPEHQYIYDKNFSIQIYRITYTNPDGKVYEFTARQVENWCKEHGLHPVESCYYGYAKDMYNFGDEEQEFGDWFLEQMKKDKSRYMECSSPTCTNSVPHEGIVIRLEDENIAYKVKCNKFLDKELKDLDKGVSNIEDDQSN